MIKKQLFNVLLFCVVMGIFSCNGNDDAVNTDDIKPITNETPVFKVLAIRHPVADFDKWLKAYQEHDSVRQAYGISHMYIGRDITNPSNVLVIDRIQDVEKAKEFAQLPQLAEVMKDAGVTGEPEFAYVDVLRSDTSNKSNNRVMISHKVSDWDSWLKAYDEEGSQTRKQHGLTDVGLGRSIENPELVYVVFAVDDMEKAKARISSDELKQLMMSAGVEGEPEIFWYKISG
jgi:quinol monooxygenase YgiN